MKNLLFHPHITLVAGLAAIGAFSALLVTLPLHNIPHGDAIVTIAGIVGPIAIFIATYGRSPASAVDNAK